MYKIVAMVFAFGILIFGVEIYVEGMPKKLSAEVERPNFLIILVDDLGYSDLGSFGGEINTPNLDALAYAGVRLTNFYVGPTCSPTRAMLMTSNDSHVVGLGNMAGFQAPNQKGVPGYEGFLNDAAVTLPTLLKDGGYHTYMTGKWHLGGSDKTNPAAKGFEKSFALINGAGGHFNTLPAIGPEKSKYLEDGVPAALPKDFYSTRFYVDKMIKYLEEDAAGEKPFFAYLAFTAPHWPLQAPEASIAKYRGVYDEGYGELYNRRMKRMSELGLLPEGAQAVPRISSEAPWNSLNPEQKKYEARKMEIYAAMVDDIDVNVGRLLAYLEEIGERENTVIIIMSDNGAEGHRLEKWDELRDWISVCCDNGYDNMGKSDSFIWYGPNWAQAGSGPFRYYKGLASEGAIKSPAFIQYSQMMRGGEVSEALVSVKDIMPTLLDWAHISDFGTSYRGRPVEGMKGISMLPFLSKAKNQVHPGNYVMGWELFGNRAIRQGDWKIVWQREPYGAGQWQLYNIKTDPSEQVDLVAEQPDRLKKMILLWNDYAAENNVILPDALVGYSAL